MALLPDTQRQEVMAGRFPESVVATSNEVERPAESEFPATSTSLSIPSSNDSSVAPWTEHKTVWKPASFETPLKKGGPFENHNNEFGSYGLRGRLFNNAEIGVKPQVSAEKHFKFRNKSARLGSPISISPFKYVNQTPSRVLPSSNLRDDQSDKLSPDGENRRFMDQLDSESPYFSTFTANPITTPSSNRGLFKYNSDDFQPSVNSKRIHPERHDRQHNMASLDDLMDVYWGNGHKDFAVGAMNVNAGSRWRSDETSDEEDEPSPERALGTTHHPIPMRGVRRSRFAKR